MASQPGRKHFVIPLNYIEISIDFDEKLSFDILIFFFYLLGRRFIWGRGLGLDGLRSVQDHRVKIRFDQSTQLISKVNDTIQKTLLTGQSWLQSSPNHNSLITAAQTQSAEDVNLLKTCS